MSKMSPDQIQQALQNLTNWRYEPAKGESADQIVFEPSFKDFNEAFGVMSRVALYAERADHHPTFTNTYADLKIALSTHDAGGVTKKDVDMASFIDEICT